MVGAATQKAKGEVAAEDGLVGHNRRVAERGVALTLSAQEQGLPVLLPLRALLALQIIEEGRPPGLQRDNSGWTSRCLTPTCAPRALMPHSQRTRKRRQAGGGKRYWM